MRNAELFAELTFVGQCEAKQLVELSTARQVSRGRKPLVALRRERNSLN